MWRSFSLALCAVALLALSGCNRLRGTDTRPLDQAGMWYDKIEELKGLAVTDSEIAEIVRMKHAGISDATCTELIRQARMQKRPFAGGDMISDLARAGISEPTILQLGLMKQLPDWAGEAAAIRLTGLSDQVLLAAARRRAAAEPVLSGPVIAQLKNVQFTEAQILNYINGGTTDDQAGQIIAAKRRAVGSTAFVRVRGRKPRAR